MDHSFTVLSSDPEATTSPFADTATAFTRPTCRSGWRVVVVRVVVTVVVVVRVVVTVVAVVVVVVE
jgi:hypothetical protein